jgi:hypothetical protein
VLSATIGEYPGPQAHGRRSRYAPAMLGAGLMFLAVVIVLAMVVTGVGIFLRMWQLRRR